MDIKILLVGLLLAGIIVVFLWYIIKPNKQKEETPTITYSDDYIRKSNPPEGKTDGGGTRVTYGGGLNPKRPELVVEPTHTITKIYSSGKKKMIWICPNCEVENSQEDKICCVCRKAV